MCTRPRQNVKLGTFTDVVVVQRRRHRNVQKSVMRGQSCCLINLNLLLFSRSRFRRRRRCLSSPLLIFTTTATTTTIPLSATPALAAIIIIRTPKKTLLKKWYRDLFIFMAIIPTVTLSHAGELFRSWTLKNNVQKFVKNSSWLVYVLHKMEIRHFHVVVVWWRQKKNKNVQKSVMHVQSCCCSFDVLVAVVVDRILRSLFPLPLPLPIPVTRYYFHYQYQYQCHYSLPATRYPLPATRYSLPLTLYPSTTVTCADFESNQRPFLIFRQMLLLGAHMIDYHVKDPL